MRKTTLIVALCVMAFSSTSVATGAEEKAKTVRVGLLWVDNNLDFRQAEDGTSVGLTGDAGFGLGLAVEYPANERVGVELGAQWSENDLQLELRGEMFCGSAFCAVTATDSVRPLTLSLGLNFHLTPERGADLYVGPVLGYVLYPDADFRAMGEAVEVSIDDDLAWGGVIGLDVPFGDRGWQFSASIRYLQANADATGRDDEGEAGRASIDLDPLTVAVGVGYRF